MARMIPATLSTETESRAVGRMLNSEDRRHKSEGEKIRLRKKEEDRSAKF